MWEGTEALRESLRGVRWVAPDEYHVTFRFLGDFEAERLPGLFRSVERAAVGRPPSVTVSGVGAFPKRGLPRVLWVGASGERFPAIKSSLDTALESLCGVDPEKRAFRSHVTIGRVKHGFESRPADHLVLPDLEAGTFSLPELVVVESELNRHGPRYTTRYAATFRDEGADQGTV